ncbi:MAG: hypothetical protein F6K54_26460 [Okeania sp. SIO3B5]|uniref:hypothetical protein n=1 Tax=Okeania sp. SIO3B5 TaxID=2607811 RepID=UPI0013FEB89C|nr:hypothetical protein [Okeania sp. SIO3B5]NEO56315.1 hypothetical protein [Okeania sp. SIO3B5]
MAEEEEKEMPFRFRWCYEDEEEGEICQVLLLDQSDTVPPLHLDIANDLEGKKISVDPLDGITAASSSNYHFKLAFNPGILVEPQSISLESDNWSISYEGDANADSLYLLWTGNEPIVLKHDEATEIILTGLAAQTLDTSQNSPATPLKRLLNFNFWRSLFTNQTLDISDNSLATPVKRLLNFNFWRGLFTDVTTPSLASTKAADTATTDVTISWQLEEGIIDIKNIIDTTRRLPGQDDEYEKSTTLTLDMVQATGKSNIPLFVGFVNCNQVLNTNNELSNLQLRITNTNLPEDANPDVEFQYDRDITLSSQLIIMLDVGTETDTPWALGKIDEVNSISINIEGGQWKQNGTVKEVKLGDTVKALQWSFIPNNVDVILSAQETILINLSNIVTNHPTGQANLYLYYKRVKDYKDGKFTCQIEKGPLTLSDKEVTVDSETLIRREVRIGNRAVIKNAGPLIFRSDVDDTGDLSSVKFFVRDEKIASMNLDADRDLHVTDTLTAYRII